ncbi:hypothetical protein LTR53_003198 [Teratosphaeriaceae sp. CCFEE 6253]|nr:hypothetical protein LTR53_003198 [Teratosphaeriaceae sp. CCFEE 6253]
MFIKRLLSKDATSRLRRVRSRASTKSSAVPEESTPGSRPPFTGPITRRWADVTAKRDEKRARKAELQEQARVRKRREQDALYEARIQRRNAGKHSLAPRDQPEGLATEPVGIDWQPNPAGREPSVERGRSTRRTATGSLRSVRSFGIVGPTNPVQSPDGVGSPSVRSPSIVSGVSRASCGPGERSSLCNGCAQHHLYAAREIVGFTSKHIIQTAGSGRIYAARGNTTTEKTDLVPIYGPVRRACSRAVSSRSAASRSPSAARAGSPGERSNRGPIILGLDRILSSQSKPGSEGSEVTVDVQQVQDRAQEHRARHGRNSLAQWRSGRPDQATAPPRAPTPGRAPTARRDGSPHTLAEPEWVVELWSTFSRNDGAYDTPQTSPEASPVKSSRPELRRLPQLHASQLDGVPSDPMVVEDDYGSQADSGEEGDEETPLVPASPAKGAQGFPFSPARAGIGSPQRQPSALRRHCQRNAMPRQRRLMAFGLQSPDRFVAGRTGTPTKEALISTKLAEKSNPTNKPAYTRSAVDPFAPPVRRTFRMAEQLAAVRAPAPLPRAPGRAGTLAITATGPDRRAVSDGAVWTVGGTQVTGGVPSTPNGRGGRVTSGTSASHHTADFMRRNSANEDERTHGKRLALAMDIDQGTRMRDPGSPRSPMNSGAGSSPASFATRTWRDGIWEAGCPVSPSKSRPKKGKGIPTIPFRVLDAPALRDDYYCSLLAYSPTLDCLAVGLGSHVYLWSEQKNATNRQLPDSLTAPFAAHVTSISFSSVDGGSAILAVGRADGRITLWSPLDRDPRFDSEQPAPISCVAFRPTTAKRPSIREPCVVAQTEELLVGDEAGNVYLYAVEWPHQEQRDLFDWHGSMTLLARVSCHTQQVCGMAWSPDGEMFATGGNDNQLFLFDRKKILRATPPSRTLAPGRDRGGSDATVNVRSSGPTPNTPHSPPGQQPVLLITPGQHRHLFQLNAAVKALAFAPWQPSLLAAGGGSNDRCIHFFHAASGAKLATIDCCAQVTSLVWSARRREVAATFGFAQPEHRIRVAVFGWPGCECRVEVPWVSEERALWGIAYPRGPAGGGRGGGGRGEGAREEGCLVVATSDASIKFHEVWAEASVPGDGMGVLGGSQILEGTLALERAAGIR